MGCLRTLRAQILQMRNEGKSREQIQRYCRRNLIDLTKHLSEFQPHQEKYEANKQELTSRVSQLSRKVLSSRPAFCDDDLP